MFEYCVLLHIIWCHTHFINTILILIMDITIHIHNIQSNSGSVFTKLIFDLYFQHFVDEIFQNCTLTYTLIQHTLSRVSSIFGCKSCSSNFVFSQFVANQPTVDMKWFLLFQNFATEWKCYM